MPNESAVPPPLDSESLPPGRIRLRLVGAALVLIAFAGVGCGVRVRRAWIELDVRDCQWNLTRIDGAKEQYALESNIRPKNFPAIDDLAPSDGKGYIKTFPACPAGFSYTIGAIGEDPTCGSGLPGHDLASVPSDITDLSAPLPRDGRPVPSLLHRLLIMIR